MIPGTIQLDILMSNLTNTTPLFFVLGAFAALVKGDHKLPGTRSSSSRFSPYSTTPSPTGIFPWWSEATSPCQPPSARPFRNPTGLGISIALGITFPANITSGMLLHQRIGQ
jgi:hypothetical protein